MGLSSQKYLWQEALSDLVTDPRELLTLLQLDADLLEAAEKVARIFPLKVTRSFLSRIQKGNPNDPLLRQVLPLGAELNPIFGYQTDPLQEAKVNPIPGLLHKYPGRVLVMLTSACAIHCRYCFRRHFPYEDNNPGRKGWEKIFAYIGEDKSIKEVILSGGDPFSVNDTVLKLFSDQLNLIPHVKILRVHTRLPIVLPERITDSLLVWIEQLKQQFILVVHTNHPQEIDDNVKNALERLGNTKAHLLNQSVLLKDINDDVTTLMKLSEALFAAGVLPYYLHLLDKVEGSAHFELPLFRAQALHAELTQRLPGYLVPRLVCEEAGKMAKTLLSNNNIS